MYERQKQLTSDEWRPSTWRVQSPTRHLLQLWHKLYRSIFHQRKSKLTKTMLFILYKATQHECKDRMSWIKRFKEVFWHLSFSRNSRKIFAMQYLLYLLRAEYKFSYNYNNYSTWKISEYDWIKHEYDVIEFNIWNLYEFQTVLEREPLNLDNKILLPISKEKYCDLSNQLREYIIKYDDLVLFAQRTAWIKATCFKFHSF